VSLQGRCLCGGVTYEIVGELPTHDGDLPLPVYCHCTDYQLHTGGAFFASFMVPLAQFAVIKRLHLLRRYESRTGVFRSLCSHCRSPMLYEKRDEPGQLYFALGTVPGFALKPRAHIFVRSKTPWYDIDDDLPQFDEYPRDDQRPELTRLLPIPSVDADAFTRPAAA
jgi:hypothetical protein